jgi:hypothetical protein
MRADVPGARSARIRGARNALTAGVLLGAGGDVLLRGGEPGLNLALWIMAVALAAPAVRRRAGGRLSGEAYALLGVAMLFAAALVWRDSPALKLLTIVAAAAALATPALRAGAAWMRRGRVLDYLAAGAAAALHAVGGAALALRASDPVTLLAPRGRQWRHAAAVMRGALLALPVLIVFAALFGAADAVFAGLLGRALRVDLDVAASHLLFAGFLTWVTAGYLHGFVSGAGGHVLDRVGRRPAVLGVTEIAVALGLVNLLFFAFVVVQFRYLFGGGGVVEVTPGLTWAEYARRGFFELVAAVLLVLPLLLGADALRRRNRRADDVIFRVVAGMQILLVLAIASSAIERMRLYRAAWGLTEQRVYATALLVLIGFVLVWFAATVLRGRRRDFAVGAFVAGLIMVAALHALNPDALIVRTNIERSLAADSGSPLDVGYATSLSADAVPVLLEALPSLDVAARCTLARRMLRNWGPDTTLPLRGWNWSAARAREAVAARATSLREMAGPGDACPSPIDRAAG